MIGVGVRAWVKEQVGDLTVGQKVLCIGRVFVPQDSEPFFECVEYDEGVLPTNCEQAQAKSKARFREYQLSDIPPFPQIYRVWYGINYPNGKSRESESKIFVGDLYFAEKQYDLYRYKCIDKKSMNKSLLARVALAKVEIGADGSADLGEFSGEILKEGYI